MDEAEVHRRMLDRDLAPKRKAALALLDTAVTPIAAAYAHDRQKAGSWERLSALCWSRVYIQKSSSGFMCFLNVGYTAVVMGQRGTLRSTRVGAFAPSVADHNRLDSLYYVDLGPVSPLRDEMLDLMARRVMPWLDRCHSPAGTRERAHAPFGLMPQ
jgi:hypothetical protein